MPRSPWPRAAPTPAVCPPTAATALTLTFLLLSGQIAIAVGRLGWPAASLMEDDLDLDFEVSQEGIARGNRLEGRGIAWEW